MSRAFDRRAVLTVDTIRIDTDSLRFAFEVEKTGKPEPNKASVTIWNLSEPHWKQLQEMKAPAVQIEAGYRDSTGVIFLGKLRTSGTVREGANLVTTLESGDGTELRTARVNLSIAKGTQTDQVLRSLASYLGVGKGNLDDAARTIRSAFSGTGNVFSAGTVLSGSAAREMTAICRSLGLEWSVQDGKLQIVERKKALLTTAIRLHKATGMIHEPTADNKGVITVQSLLQPDAFPGRACVIEGDRLQAQIRIDEVRHSGDSRDPSAEWLTEIKGKRY